MIPVASRADRGRSSDLLSRRSARAPLRSARRPSSLFGQLASVGEERRLPASWTAETDRQVAGQVLLVAREHVDLGSGQNLALRGGKHPPLVGDAPQGMPAAILEGDPGAHDEVLDRR